MFPLASVFCLVRLILPNNESKRDYLFKTIRVINFNLRRPIATCQFKTKWKGNCNRHKPTIVEERLKLNSSKPGMSSKRPNPHDAGIVLHASCVSHFVLYVAELTEHGKKVGKPNALPYVADLVRVYYGGRMDVHHRTRGHGRLRILVLAGVTCKPWYPDRNWCGWMRWRTRFCLETLGLDHWYCYMFVGRLYWQRFVQVRRLAKVSAEQRK